MQLQSLIVSGFKSFHEAKINFPQGMTAVVGPNGAGKSNLVDAILWVLGEQSTKTLRSERMEDVIFNGTESKKPLGMAEVSLVVTDVTSQELASIVGVVDDLPGQKEFMITRRLYRDGDSEYFMNKIPCRLKDVRSLFLEARAGTKGHTVIEQGHIDHILSGSSQDRRSFIEETAGIGRFKKQKTEALRKLNATQHNLLRVRDVIGEVQKQLQTLERQARQAEHYEKLQDECRVLEINILRWDYEELRHGQADLEGRIAIYEVQEAEHMANEANIMATHAQLKADQLQDGESVGNTQETLRKIEYDMGQTFTTLEVERNRRQLYEEQESQAIEEQAKLGQQSARVLDAMGSLKQQLQQAMEEVQRAEQTMARLDVDEQCLVAKRSSVHMQVETLRQQILEQTVERTQTETHLQNVDARQKALGLQIQQRQADQQQGNTERLDILSRLTTLREKLERLTQHVHSLRTNHEEVLAELSQLDQHIQEDEQYQVKRKTEQAAAESRLAALQAVFREEFGYEGGMEGKSSSIRHMCHGVKEAIGERLEVPQPMEHAVEAALGEHIRAWVVEEEKDIIQAVQVMNEYDLGRGTFIPMQPYDLSEDDQPRSWWSELKHQKGVIGRATDLVSIPENLSAVLHCLLDRVVVIQDLDQALTLVRQRRWSGSSAPPLFATLSGEIIETSGVVSGGSVGNSSGVLQRRREVRTLESHIAENAQSLKDAEHRQEELCQQHQSATEHLRTLNESLKDTERTILIVENEIGNAEQHSADVEEQVHSVTMELAASQEEQGNLRKESQTCQGRLVQLGHDQKTQEVNVQLFIAQLQELDVEATRLSAQSTEARLSLTTFHERQERIQADLKRMQQEEETRHSRLHFLIEHIQRLRLKIQEGQAKQTSAERLFTELEQQKDEHHRQLQIVEKRYQAGMGHVRELEQQLADIRRHYTSTREKRAEIEVQLAEVRTRLQTVIDTLTGTYGQLVTNCLNHPLGQEHTEIAAETTLTKEEFETWRERIRIVRTRLERMGPLNLGAIDEHRELEERYQFLAKQETDLSESVQSLQAIIDRLSRTTNQMFEETFKAVQQKFSEVFSALFAGGQVELVLVRPESDEGTEDSRLEPGVDIVAQPPGKRLKNLSMLSGGEKALTVLALLFANFLINPSPFCILDEVDAPLDEPNVIRFAQFLTQLTSLSQFLVITHNKRTMEIADSLFGVTMEEPGVSKFVSVRISDLQKV